MKSFSKSIIFLLLFLPEALHAQVMSSAAMERIYQEVKSPYKYGMVVAPQDTHHQIDCPTVYQDRWYSYTEPASPTTVHPYREYSTKVYLKNSIHAPE